MSPTSLSNSELFNVTFIIDDEICSDDPELGWKETFADNCALELERTVFTTAHDDALEIMENNPKIGLALVDIRIPKRSEDLDDFNPEDPLMGWGSSLIRKLEKYKEKGLTIIIITGYSESLLTDPRLLEIADAYYQKPFDDEIYEAIQEKIKEVRNGDRWKKDFDYSGLNEETANFIRERTQEIRLITRRMSEDILKIGKYVTEIKEKLEYGQFEDWVETNFPFTPRMARNFMSAYNTFKDRSEKIADLNFPQSVLFKLSESATTEEAIEETIARAREGEKITGYTASKIQQKHAKKPKEKSNPESQQTEIDFSSSTVQEDRTPEKLTPSTSPQQQQPSSPTPKLLDLAPENPPPSTSSPQQQIIGVTKNIVTNSYWQLGKKHYLFCGEPKNELFLAQLPPPVVILTFPSRGEVEEKTPLIRTKGGVIYNPEYDLMPIEELEKTIEYELQGLTKGKDIVLFSYLYHPKLFFLAHKMYCRCYIAEPNLELCDRVIKDWKKTGESVTRIKL